METGSIIMLIIIIVGIFGGTGMLVARNLRNEAKNQSDQND